MDWRGWVGGDLFLIDLPVWLNLNDESSCDREWLWFSSCHLIGLIMFLGIG